MRASSTSGGWSAAIGIVLLLVAALGVVVQLKDALNTIFEAKEPENAGIAWYVRVYGVSLAGILALGFLLAVSLVISTALAAFSSWIGGSAAGGILLMVINFVISLAVLTLLFAMLFKWFPDTPLAWADVWPGAVATALLFNVGKAAISWYIGTQGLEFHLRRGGIHRCVADMGVLFGADCAVWRRTHARLCQPAQVGRRCPATGLGEGRLPTDRRGSCGVRCGHAHGGVEVLHPGARGRKAGAG